MAPSDKTVTQVAVDWGTSHVRLWVMDSAGNVIDALHSDKGMGTLTAADYEPTLLALLGDHLTGPVDVVICGMAGSRQGWAEAAYASTPCMPPTIATATQVETRDPRLNVSILPGIKQMSPADVMRGEETQIAGFLATSPDFDGVLCLPGTHTKWAHISASEVVSFRTFMTGEMFALLASRSVLRHSVGTGWDGPTFETAVNDAISRPAAIAAELFSLRAASLLSGADPDAARARLSGLLIGAELAAARPYWLGQQVVVLGADGIADAYLSALQNQGVSARGVDPDHMTLRGLTAALTKTERAST